MTAIVLIAVFAVFFLLGKGDAAPRRRGGYRPLPPANGRPWAGCRDSAHATIHDCTGSGELRPPRGPAASSTGTARARRARVTVKQVDTLAREKADNQALAQGDLPYADISWVCVRHEYIHPILADLEALGIEVQP